LAKNRCVDLWQDNRHPKLAELEALAIQDEKLAEWRKARHNNKREKQRLALNLANIIYAASQHPCGLQG
jgi:hypothetical protein